jgi:hypothetical protein
MGTLKTPIGLSLSFCLIVSPCAFAQTLGRAAKSDDRVTITPHRTVFPRKSPLIRRSQQREKVLVVYPVITGLRNKIVLKRIRTLLQLKNIFGSTLAEYRESGWLEEFVYTVNYNQNHILDLTFTEYGSGMHAESDHKHFTIDLRTGNVVKATDVFLAERRDQLSNLVNEKLQQELKESREQILRTDEISARDLDALYGPLRFKAANLSDFEVTRDGVIFLYDSVFPHVVRALAPVGRYRLTYAELKPYLRPDGLLWQFVD